MFGNFKKARKVVVNGKAYFCNIRRSVYDNETKMLVVFRRGFLCSKTISTDTLHYTAERFQAATGKTQYDEDFYSSLIDWWVPQAVSKFDVESEHGALYRRQMKVAGLK